MLKLILSASKDTIPSNKKIDKQLTSKERVVDKYHF
jgi:hypothetical protein